MLSELIEFTKEYRKTFLMITILAWVAGIFMGILTGLGWWSLAYGLIFPLVFWLTQLAIILVIERFDLY